MPMPPQVDRVVWDGDDVAKAHWNVTVAPRAEVDLVGLIGLDGASLRAFPKVKLRFLGHYLSVPPMSVSAARPT